MNRRELIKHSMQAAVAIALAAVGIRAAEPREWKATAIVEGLPLPCDPDNSCHAWMVEQLGRKLMADTGDWKQWLWDSRQGKIPIVVTRMGCCCCQITLRDGARHPDWTYEVRPMSAAEQRTFREEYGKSAGMLLNLPMGGHSSIRGFVLNGRWMGWNISVERGPSD